MAKGFITLENGEDYFSRWTGYDMIIKIAIKELQNIENGGELAEWLKTRIPAENEHKGDAIFFNAKDEMVQRILDLRGLTRSNRRLFWEAIEKGAESLTRQGKEYSNLNPDRITELLELHHKTPDDIKIEEKDSEFIVVQEDIIEKIGPGWIKN